MEYRNNNHNGNGLGSGFLLGVVVGVIITLLFTTKKGREIVKELTEKGLDKFSTLQDILDENLVDEEFEEEGDDYVEKEVVQDYKPNPQSSQPQQPVQPHTAPREQAQEKVAAQKTKASVKRFFRLKKT